MEKKSFDCYLMNAVYLSELWAFQDLDRFKKNNPELWNDEREQQLNDEMRHYKMCLAALREEDSQICHDLNFSMQARLYSQLFQFDPPKSLKELSGIHHIFEKRAVWVFKTYQKVGSNEKFKKIYKAILKDESVHNQQLKIFSTDGPGFELNQIDRKIWKQLLPGQFGRKIFSSNDLWQWYYGSHSTPFSQIESGML